MFNACLALTGNSSAGTTYRVYSALQYAKVRVNVKHAESYKVLPSLEWVVVVH